MAGPYSHKTKAGNQGDVLKHSVLLAAVHAQISHSKWTKKRPFIYAETHAGWPTYRVWKEDAKVFRSLVSRSSDGVPTGAKLYKESLEKNSEIYLGSSALIRELFYIYNIPNKIILHDIDKDIVAALGKYHKTDFIARCSDGFIGLDRISDVSFVLLDPPCRDKKVLKIIKSANERGVPYVAWAPLTGDSPNNRPSSPSLQYVKDLQAQNASVFAARHTRRWSGQMCGSIIACSSTISEHVEATFRYVTKLMKWQVISDPLLNQSASKV